MLSSAGCHDSIRGYAQHGARRVQRAFWHCAQEQGEEVGPRQNHDLSVALLELIRVQPCQPSTGCSHKPTIKAGESGCARSAPEAEAAVQRRQRVRP